MAAPATGKQAESVETIISLQSLLANNVQSKGVVGKQRAKQRWGRKLTWHGLVEEEGAERWQLDGHSWKVSM